MDYIEVWKEEEDTRELMHELLVSLQNLGKWIKIDMKEQFKEHALRIVREDKSDPVGRSVQEFRNVYEMMPMGVCGRTAAQICISNRNRLHTSLYLFLLKHT